MADLWWPNDGSASMPCSEAMELFYTTLHPLYTLPSQPGSDFQVTPGSKSNDSSPISSLMKPNMSCGMWWQKASYMMDKANFEETKGTTGNRSNYIPQFMVTQKYPTGKKLFSCPQCRYITDRKNNLKRHIGTMHQDCGKVLECCDFVFRSKAALRDHVTIFHKNGYKCRHCGRNFCRKALLKRHLAVHDGQKEFTCSICDYATNHRSNLDRHRRTHTLKSFFESEEDERQEEKLTNYQALRHDQYNFYYLSSDPFKKPGSLYGKRLCLYPKYNLFRHRRHRGELTTLDVNYATNATSTRSLNGEATIAKSDSVLTERNENKLFYDDHQFSFRSRSSKRLCMRPYKCSNCDCFFATQIWLVEHAKSCHNPKTEPPIALKYIAKKPSSDEESQGCVDPDRDKEDLFDDQDDIVSEAGEIMCGGDHSSERSTHLASHQLDLENFIIDDCLENCTRTSNYLNWPFAFTALADRERLGSSAGRGSSPESQEPSSPVSLKKRHYNVFKIDNLL